MEPFRSYYSVIPGYVDDCKTIEPNAKRLYGELTRLSHQYGYSWATNDYLAQRFEVDKRTIARWLKSLKEHKFIFIETEVHRIQRQRRIWISKEAKSHFQNNFAKGHFCHDVGTFLSPGVPPSPYNKNNTIEEDIYAPQAEPAVAIAPAPYHSSLPKKKKEPPLKIEVAPSVWLTEKQQEIILKECQGDEQKRKECYEICSAWKVDNSDDQNDFRRFKKWIYSAYDKRRESPPEQKRVEINRLLAQKACAKYKDTVIHVGPSYIEVTTGIHVAHILFSDKEFKKKLTAALAAKKLDVGWLNE